MHVFLELPSIRVNLPGELRSNMIKPWEICGKKSIWRTKSLTKFRKDLEVGTTHQFESGMNGLPRIVDFLLRIVIRS